jgi:glutathione S-transferase
VSVKLYSGPLSMFGAKSEIALREKNLPFDLEMVAFSQAQGYHPRHPEILRVNPKRQIPVLIDGDVQVYDSTQIFEYLEHRYPQPPLWPASPAARARARHLGLASDQVLLPHVNRHIGLRAKPDPVDKPEWIQAREGIEAYYTQMEALLADRDWLAGEYSYADIAFYMAQFFAARHTVPMGTGLVKLLDWRRRMASRMAVRPVIETMARYLRSIDYPVPDYGT